MNIAKTQKLLMENYDGPLESALMISEQQAFPESIEDKINSLITSEISA